MALGACVHGRLFHGAQLWQGCKRVLLYTTIDYDINFNKIENKTIISNDNEKLFGKVIDSISVNTAIDMERLCDYKIVVNKR